MDPTTTRGARGHRAALLALALLLAWAPVGLGCGVGGDGANTVGFEIAAVGPAGGTVKAGDVTVVIAPGALAETTSVSILPQGTPLPILPLQGDPCTYAFLGPIWCVGPVGTPMAVAGTLRVIYDPALIPAGVDPSDLVLMLWDDTLGALVPTTLGITHDVGLARFTFPAYVELGHVAVGVRTCLPPQGNPGWVIPLRVLPAQVLPTQQVLTTGGIYLGDADQPAVPPAPRLLTAGELPAFAQPSVDGQTILFGQYQPNEDFVLFTVPTDSAGGPAAELPTDHGALFGNDGVLGWWLGSGGSTDVFFPEYEDFSQEKAAGTGGTAATGIGRDGQMINLTPASGLGTVDTWHQGFPIQFLADIRQAEDGLHALVVWEDYSNEVLQRVVEVIAADGTVVSSDTIPFGGGLFSPRIVPSGDAVTRVADDGRSVIQCDLEGLNEVVLMTLPVNDPRRILDFVADPTGTLFLALVEVTSGNLGESHELWLGSYDGVTAAVLDIETLPIPSTFFFDDLVWHPTGPYAYLGLGFQGTLPIGLTPLAAMGSRIGFHPILPIPSIGHMDVNRLDGRLLVTVVGSGRSLGSKPGVGGSLAMFDADGVWLSDPDGENAVRLADAPGTATDLPARWLTGWRRAPGLFTGVR
jgi:hypothetical protein